VRLWPWGARKAAPAAEDATGATLPLDPRELRDAMAAFLRGGGTVSLAEWLAMPDGLKAALEGAGAALRAEGAIELAAALSGPDGAEEVSRRIDGGDAAGASAAQRAMAKASAMLAGRSPIGGAP
jgi:hypothetical protein